MAVPSLGALKTAFSAVTWQRGSSYQRVGRANVASVSADGTRVEGRVFGTGSKPYKLRTLEAAGQSESEDYPDTVRQRLICVRDVHVWPIGRREVRVQPVSVRLLKDGTCSTNTTIYEPTNLRSPQGGATVLRPSDRAILEAILDTGRGRWKDVTGPVLVKGGIPAPAGWPGWWRTMAASAPPWCPGLCQTRVVVPSSGPVAPPIPPPIPPPISPPILPPILRRPTR